MNHNPSTPEHDELLQQLWEFVYQLLDDDETARLQALITSDPDVARRYSEVKQQSNLLASAAKLDDKPVEFNAPAADAQAASSTSAAAAPSTRHSLGNWCAALAASLLLAIVGYAYLQPQSPLNTAAVARQEKALAENQPHIAVTAPRLLQAEMENQISVSVSTQEGEPQPAEIEYQVYSTRDGRQLIPAQKAVTNEVGLATLSIPGSSLDGPARIDLVASYNGGRSKHLSTHVELDQPRFTTHLSFDKPLYQPGETVRFRSLTLSRFGMWPVDLTPIEYEIRDPGDALVPGAQFSGVTKQGVGNEQFEIPSGSPGGNYKLIVRSTNGLFPEQSREFQVREYRPPQFKKELELIRDSYAPGEEVVADFAAWRGTGEPLAGTNVYVQATVDGTPLNLPQAAGQTASDGTYRVKFQLPEQIETGAGVLVVTVDDGGTRETISETIPINLGKVEVEFFPEGGELAAGLPNRVYFSASDPVGEPVHITGRVLDSANKEVAKLETEHEGRGRFEFTPTAVDVYRLVIDSPAEVTNEPQLPAAQAKLPLTLSSSEFVYDNREPLTLTVNARNRKGRYVVAAMCRGAQVGQLPLAKLQFEKVKQASGTPEHFQANLKLPLSDAADGVIRLTVYDYAENPPRPIAERLVYRRPHRKLSVRVGGHSEYYSPGSPVDLTFLVTDESGQPAPAVLGVSVVADTLLNLADDKSATMTSHFLLTSEVAQPEDLEDANFFLTDDPEAPSALDLLLGVQGWRRFVGLPAEQFAAADMPWESALPMGEVAPDDIAADEQLAEREEQLARLVQLDGAIEAPLQHDNTDTLASELVMAKQMFNIDRQQHIRTLGMVLAAAGAVVLLGMLLVAVARWSSGLMVWSPVLLGAVGCIALGLLWTRAYVEPDGQLAYAPLSQLSDDAMVAMSSTESASGSASVPEPTIAEMEGSALDPFEEHDELMLEFAPGEAVPLNAPQPAAPFADFAPADAPKAFGAMAGEELKFDDKKNARLEKLPAPAQMRMAQERLLPNNREAEMLDADADRARGGFAAGGRANGLMMKEGMARQRRAKFDDFQGPQFQVREYYHQHKSTDPDVREDFQESICWQPLLEVNDDGMARLHFELSDLVTAFKVQVDAHSPASTHSTTAGRIGSGTGEVISRIPFRLEPKLPVEVTTGDRIDLPLAVINDSRNPLEVGVNLDVPNLFSLTGESQRTVYVASGERGREWFALNVTGSRGEAELTLRGESAGRAVNLRDAIRQTVRVTPGGFPVEKSYAGTLDGEQQLMIDLPADMLEGSLEVTLKAFPSTLADMQKGVDSILREPHGCFEQTSSSNYPNIMALQYMEEHDVADPSFTKRAKELLDKGYGKLTTFESPEHGYEWFGGNPGHEALTAYGLMEFRDMEQVYNVNSEMVQRTAKWLMQRRDGKGGFLRNERALDSFGRAPQDITDAYIVWALTEANQPNIETELQHVLDLANKSDDPYLIAMAARSALNAGRQQAGVDLLGKLTKLQADDGHLAAKESTITRSGGISMKVETTAIAAMAWLKHASGQPSAQKAIEWINANRQGAGGFGSTQATILALKALTEYTRANRKTSSAGELIARLNVGSEESETDSAESRSSEGESSLPSTTLPDSIDGPIEPVADTPAAATDSREAPADEPATETPSKKVTFAAGDSEAIELQGLEAILKAGKNELTVDLTGDNQMPYVLDIRYRVGVPQSDDASPVRFTAELGAEQVLMGESIPLNVTLENISGKGQPMTTAILGIPAGLQVRTKQLDEMKKAGKFAYYELNAREVILYWRDLSPELTGAEKLSFSLDLIGEIPGKYTGPASRAYLYYTAEQKQWLEPLVVEVTKP